MQNDKKDIMKIIARAIINLRHPIMILFLVASILCITTMDKVKINDDLTFFLPKDTETRRGISVMEDEFITYGNAEIMVSNITYDIAEDIKEKIENTDHVTSVTFDDTKAHFNSSSALFTVSFDGTNDDENAIASLDSIKESLSDYDVYISSEVGYDFSAIVAGEVTDVLLTIIIIIVAVLLFTSRSYFEVVIFLIVFGVAAILNMGTNYFFGEISSITNSIAVILQLALAIDYAIIFSHRYQDEAEKYPAKEALVNALSKAIIEIFSSSLTTVSGLVALTLMRFRLGYDLGTVLAKGILCSLITVFLLMPGIIMFFPKMIERAKHKTNIPDITGWGNVLAKTKIVFVILFALILPFSIYFSSHAKYAFDDSTITEIVQSDSRYAMRKIKNTFDENTTIALIVPHENYQAQKEIIEKIKTFPETKTVTGLAGIEIDDGKVLTDSFTPRMLSELLDIDYEEALLLFQAYGAEHENYEAIFGSGEKYSVPLVDMITYIFDKTDKGIINLDGDRADELNDLRQTLEIGIDQLMGESHDRIIIVSDVPAEGDKATEEVEKIRAVAEEYYSDDVLVCGNITSARDLGDTFNSDSMKINLLTIAFVFVILLFTFKSVVGAGVLVFVIQGSIWINFAFQYLTGDISSFVTKMIVSAIQMGATIDYAIVLMNRYMKIKGTTDKKTAISKAVNESFPTVLTSGLILTVAGFLIAFKVSDVYIGHIGLAVGRGTLISIILVLTVLPQMIMLLDRAIEKTTFNINIKKPDIKKIGFSKENEEQ